MPAVMEALYQTLGSIGAFAGTAGEPARFKNEVGPIEFIEPRDLLDLAVPALRGRLADSNAKRTPVPIESGHRSKAKRTISPSCCA